MTIMIPTWVNGALTPVEKLEAHKRGLRHKAVSVFLIDGNQTLIQRRALGKYHTPGLWANTCCTHPGWDEPAPDCAKRRLEEELGITGVTLSHVDQVEYRADVGGGLIEHEVVDIFRGEAGRSTTIAPNPAEVMDTRWLSFEELATEIAMTPEKFTPWLRIYMKEHLAGILGAGGADHSP